MHSKNLNRPEPGAEKVTPFKRKERKPPARRPPAGADAFLVKTEKILFLATVCAGDNDAYQSWGYIFFNQGGAFQFSLAENEYQNVHEKCRRVAGRIAHVYGGDLRQGTIDAAGRFRRNDK